jgi:hypothetical protein
MDRGSRGVRAAVVVVVGGCASLVFLLAAGPMGSAALASPARSSGDFFAVVDANGTLARGSSGISVVHAGTGRYNITFPVPVGSCAAVANLGYAGTSERFTFSRSSAAGRATSAMETPPSLRQDHPAGNRLAIFVANRQQRDRRFGWRVVARQSLGHLGLIDLNGIVVPPRAYQPRHRHAEAHGEARRRPVCGRTTCTDRWGREASVGHATRHRASLAYPTTLPKWSRFWNETPHSDPR